MERLNFVTKFIGISLLAVVAFILFYVFCMGNGVMITWGFWFLLTIGIVLACEKVIATHEIKKFLATFCSDKSIAKFIRVFFLIPIIFIGISLAILVVGTFSTFRLILLVVFLFDTSGILLLYSNSFIETYALDNQKEDDCANYLAERVNDLYEDDESSLIEEYKDDLDTGDSND